MGHKKKTKEEPGTDPAVRDQVHPDLSALDLIKAKLRKKYHLLRDEPLNYDDLDQLKDHICMITGMSKPDLTVVLEQL
jgi:hypothetical protein